MVDELISNSAKVNLVDAQGKTALHCAAMVDNHKAVLVLLKNGAKVDAQDNKVREPERGFWMFLFIYFFFVKI